MRTLAHDFRYAIRMLRKNPGFTAVAMLTLAIGIGANTAMFSLTDAVLLRPLPYPEPNRLVKEWETLPRLGEDHLGAAPSEFAAYRDRTRVFSSLAGYQSANFDISSDNAPEHVVGYRVTANLFPMLGMTPLLGRIFMKDEETASASGVAVLSYGFWRRRYGEDRGVVGRVLRLNERPYRIIGVMPSGFIFPLTAASPGEPPSMWVPLSFAPGEQHDWSTSIIGRLLPGATLTQARDDAKRIAAEFQREDPALYSGNVRLEAQAAAWAPDFSARARLILWLLTGAVTCVLLIACANVANLLLARAGARQREIAVRRALGASAGRLTRQALTETATLTFAGGLAGCALAVVLVRAMNAVSITEMNMAAAAIDVRVLAFTFVVCGVACVISGTAPTWMFRRGSAEEALKQTSARQTGAGHENRRLAHSLIVAEAACCVSLLIGSGLLLRSFARILQIPPGFDPEHALVVRTVLNQQRYPTARRHAVERAVEARLAAIPGVSEVTLATHLPLADERKIGFAAEGRPPGEFHWADNSLVDANYFRVMGIRLVRGRTFADTDTPKSPLVGIVNESMAKQYWPNQDPIGQRLQWGDRHLTVIGVAGDVRLEALDQPVGPAIYNSVYQVESGAARSAVFILRIPGRDPVRFAAAARDAIRSVDSGVPILGFSALRQVISGALAIRRLSLALGEGFSLIALVLSLIGVYGVLSYDVARRVNEIGLRLALGARPRQIARDVVRDGAKLALAGIAVGVGVGAFVARSLEGLLFGIPTLDPVSFAAGVLLLFFTALMASYLPARRASRVDPMIALRYE